MGAWIETAEQQRVSAEAAVAPYVGAWIETANGSILVRLTLVAPYVGAWIETLLGGAVNNLLVAPYVGAWIETLTAAYNEVPCGSHPTWVRGLKRYISMNVFDILSRTLRGCVD